MAERPIAIWLMPSAADRVALSAWIERLARSWDTPVFEPHLTLASGMLSIPHEEFERAVKARFSSFAAPTCNVTGAAGTADRFTALYLSFAEHESVVGVTMARACAPGLRGPRVGPHLSLLYREGTTETERRGIVDSIAHAIPSRIRFEGIALAWPSAGDWGEVASWRTKSLGV